ncbi:MAG: tRNA uridine-5-carboxymethylaminomethyl(34) synthesis GTPase MnmE, partial [Beijerinckiaceae bacterium]
MSSETISLCAEWKILPHHAYGGEKSISRHMIKPFAGMLEAGITDEAEVSMTERSTIYALSSGQGRAGVAVIRVSGPAAEAAVVSIAGKLPIPRLATVSWLCMPGTNVRLDQGLTLWFPGDQSFTGEPVAEFQVHGGRAVVSGMLDALSRIPGLRLAEPGEFTRRAVENGKFDLTRAEALADLIEADTEMQRRQALAGLEGKLLKTVRGWRTHILSVKALIAADIDFSDQEDASEISATEIRHILRNLQSEMRALLLLSERARLVIDGVKVAIIGRPNVGKSSLLNVLAGSDIAIVSDIPGTTRDLLEVRLDLNGIPVRVFDTAGIHASTDPLEGLGIDRAQEAAKTADLILLIDDGLSDGPPSVGPFAATTLHVRSKADLATNSPQYAVSNVDIGISS